MQGKRAGKTRSVSSSMARTAALAGAIMGEWKGLSQLRRTARGSWPPNCRSCTSSAWMRSMSPLSTTWFFELMLASETR